VSAGSALSEGCRNEHSAGNRGSGFVGSHVLIQLLNAGHTVRTTWARTFRRGIGHRANVPRKAIAATGESLVTFGIVTAQS